MNLIGRSSYKISFFKPAHLEKNLARRAKRTLSKCNPLDVRGAARRAWRRWFDKWLKRLQINGNFQSFRNNGNFRLDIVINDSKSDLASKNDYLRSANEGGPHDSPLVAQGQCLLRLSRPLSQPFERGAPFRLGEMSVLGRSN